MSTKEIAISILNQLNEKQLEGFIAMYNGILSVNAADNTQAERNAAFDELEQIRKEIKPVSGDFSEKAEYHLYLDERYGV